MEVVDPERWSPDNPFVYTLVCQLKKGETVVDEVRQPVGFRSLAFSPEFGFKLNGKVVKLKAFAIIIPLVLWERLYLKMFCITV